MLLFIAISTIVCIELNAQPPDTIPKDFHSDSGILKKDNNGIFLLQQPQLKYLSSNKGFNIYEASIDKMIVIKPDSSFHSNMPVKKSYIIQQPITKPKP